MSVFGRIFGTGRRAQKQPQDVIEFTNAKGDERVRLTADPAAFRARHNAEMIYGRNNVPQAFGMRPVIEVKNKQGEWAPVTGGSGTIKYNLETQLGALASFRETGIIGPQPVTESSGSSIGGAGGGAAGNAGAAPSQPSLGYVGAAGFEQRSLGDVPAMTSSTMIPMDPRQLIAPADNKKKAGNTSIIETAASSAPLPYTPLQRGLSMAGGGRPMNLGAPGGFGNLQIF